MKVDHMMLKDSSESDGRKIVAVKREPEDLPRGTTKRHSSSSLIQQGSLGPVNFLISLPQYNPLDEPSPLGLNLRKSPSLLDLIQMTLTKANSRKGGIQVKKEPRSSNALSASDKLKASNFPASLLRIGTWEYKSRNEGDLVGKCYFAKHKLVWEVLDGGLKNKIEIQWSDIVALKATYPDDNPGTLDVVLSRQPLFFKETNPQPRKHTLWQGTSDFTGGQASIQRRHFLQCPQGLLGKHFEKLILCDPRLNFLSQQGEIEIDSPYFEPRISTFEGSTSEINQGLDLNGEGERVFFDLCQAASPSGSQSSPWRSDQDFIGRPPEQFPCHSTSPSSIIGTQTIEDIISSRVQELKGLLEKDYPMVPGLNSSMSMSDLVSHIEHRITEERTSNNFILSSEERQSLQILDDIRQCLFSDSQHALATDEKCLMSRVDSLCCLLQKDPSTAQSLQTKSDGTFELFENKRTGLADSIADTSAGEQKVAQGFLAPEGEQSNVFGFRQAAGMSRKDSLGDLLLNLPRIASLPQFLFNISEDSKSKAW